MARFLPDTGDYVPLICYYDGELQRDTRDPVYVGGHNRADRVRKNISFTEFAVKMHELCKSAREEATIDIKCRYIVDQHTSIAMCVEDDSSLSVIMDLHPHQCNAIVVYVEKQIAPKASTTTLSLRHKKGSSSFVVGARGHLANVPNVRKLASDGLDNSNSVVMYTSPPKVSSSLSHEKFERGKDLEIISESKLPEVRPHDCNTRSTIANEGLGQSVELLFEESSVNIVIDPNFSQSAEKITHTSVTGSSLPDRSQVRCSKIGLKLSSESDVLFFDFGSKSSKSWFTMQVLNPEDSYLQRWNVIFLSSCMVALALDALFLYTPEIDDKKSCLNWDKSMEITVCVLRSILDIIYLVHIIFQFCTGFFAPSSLAFRKGEFIEDLGAIARRYFCSVFLIDFLAVLPLPQVWTLVMTSQITGSMDVRKRKSLLYVVSLQYIPRLLRIYPLYKEHKTMSRMNMFWAGAILNFSLYILASHIFGAFWYFLSVQRESVCWRDACRGNARCNVDYLYCGDHNRGGHEFLQTLCPTAEPNATLFDFGIYLDALQSGIPKSTFSERLIYCFWWGLQNIGSLGQNLKTSAYIWEVCFAISISIFGLFLFMLLIGNVQTYLQSDTVQAEKEFRKKLQDTEQWMSRKFLPKNLRQQIRQCELHRWQITRGFDDETLLRKLPKDLKREVKRHLGRASLDRVPVFYEMDEQVVDALCHHLKPVLYPKNSYVIREGDLIDDMLFIVKGKLSSVTTNKSLRSGYLTAGDFCGEELVMWAIGRASSSEFPLSIRTLQVLEEIEAFSLEADDLKFVVSQFKRYFRSEKIRRTFKFYSHQWRTWAACFIQAAWRRYRRKKLEENKLQDALAQNVRSSASLGATINVSRFVANLLRRKGTSRKT